MKKSFGVPNWVWTLFGAVAFCYLCTGGSPKKAKKRYKNARQRATTFKRRVSRRGKVRQPGVPHRAPQQKRTRV